MYIHRYQTTANACTHHVYPQHVSCERLQRLLDDEKQVALNENFSDHKFLDELQASMYEVVANLAKKLEVCRVKSNSEREKTMCGGAKDCQEEQLAHVHILNHLRSRACGILYVYSLMYLCIFSWLP